MTYQFHALLGKISLNRYTKFLPVKVRRIFLSTAIANLCFIGFPLQNTTSSFRIFVPMTFQWPAWLLLSYTSNLLLMGVVLLKAYECLPITAVWDSWSAPGR